MHVCAINYSGIYWLYKDELCILCNTLDKPGAPIS